MFSHARLAVLTAVLALGLSLELLAQGPDPCRWPFANPDCSGSCTETGRAQYWPVAEDQSGAVVPLSTPGKVVDTFGPRLKQVCVKWQGTKCVKRIRVYDYHEGMDIRAQKPLPLVAPWPGRVAKVHAPCLEGGGHACLADGHYVLLEHEVGGQRFYSRYYHLNPWDKYLSYLEYLDDPNQQGLLRLQELMLMEEGIVPNQISQGELIGYSGRTGKVAYHLHFDTMVGGTSPLSHGVHPLRFNSLPYGHHRHPRIVMGSWYDVPGFDDQILGKHFFSFYVDSPARASRATHCEDPTGEVCDELHLNSIRIIAPHILYQYSPPVAPFEDSLVIDFDRRENVYERGDLSQSCRKILGDDPDEQKGNERGCFVTTTERGHPILVHIQPEYFYGSTSEYQRIWFQTTIPPEWAGSAGQTPLFENVRQIKVVACDTGFQGHFDCKDHCDVASFREILECEEEAQRAAQKYGVSARASNVCTTPLTILEPPSLDPPIRLEARQDHVVAVHSQLGETEILLLDDGMPIRDPDGTSPWMFTWRPEGLGQHLLTATDDQERTALSNEVRVEVTPNRTPPVVAFAEPSDEATVFGGFDVQVVLDASDESEAYEWIGPPFGVGVASVEVDVVDSDFNIVDVLFPVGVNEFRVWWTAPEEPGSYLLRAIARDWDGNDAVTELTVQVADPTGDGTIAFESPTSGMVPGVLQRVRLLAGVPYGNEFIREVELVATPLASPHLARTLEKCHWDGQSQTTCDWDGLSERNVIYELDWTPASGGRHRLTARMVYRDSLNGSLFRTANASVEIDVEDTAPPTVEIRNAPEGEVDHRLPIEVHASDNLALSRVALYADAQLVSEITGHELVGRSSYLFFWCPRTSGSSTLRAEATDGALNTTPYEVSIQAASERWCSHPPLVQLTAPSHGATVSGQVQISAQAHPAVGSVLLGVDCDVQNATWTCADSKTVSGPPFEWRWESGVAADGRHRLTAIAEGEDAESIDIVTRNVGPSIDSLSPEPDSSLTGSVGVEVTASAGQGRSLARAEFYVDDELQFTAAHEGPAYSWTWHTSLWPDGRHDLRVVVYDDLERTDLETRSLSTLNTFTAEAGWCPLVPPISPRARYSAVATYVPEIPANSCARAQARPSHVLMYGGRTTAGWTNELWKFDGKYWTDLSAGRNEGPWPPVRGYLTENPQAAVYDPVRRKVVLPMVLPGNTTGGAIWEWDVACETWQRFEVQFGPHSGYPSGAAYDPNRGRVVIHALDQLVNDSKFATWEWDGQSLSKHSGIANNIRGNNAYEYMFFINGKIEMLNSLKEGTRDVGWRWLRTSDRHWFSGLRRNAPNEPGWSFAYDDRRGEMLALGPGFREWDGEEYFFNGQGFAVWIDIPGGGGPTGRLNTAMAFHSEKEELVVFGGCPSAECGVTWTWQAGRTSCPPPDLTPDTVQAEPTWFDAPFGPGIALQWRPPLLPVRHHFESEYSVDGVQWMTLGNDPQAHRVSEIDHHGSEVFGDYLYALPSRQRYFYRIRVIGPEGNPVSDWSEEVSAVSPRWGDDNQPPVIFPISLQTVAPLETLEVEVVAEDADGDTITLDITAKPKGARFDSVPAATRVTGSFTWTPNTTELGLHQVKIVATDSYGGTRDTATAAFEIRVCNHPCGPGDEVPPVITNVNAEVSDVVIITWTTDEPATSQVEYGLSPSCDEATPVAATLVTAHTVQLDQSQLLSAMTYYYRVVSVDQAGNVSRSPVYQFESPECDGGFICEVF